MVNETKVVIGWFKLQLKMGLVDLNYNSECDWLMELSDNKLSDNELFNKKLFLSSRAWAACGFARRQAAAIC